mgnify:CR=1 FL=1
MDARLQEIADKLIEDHSLETGEYQALVELRTPELAERLAKEARASFSG